MNMEVSEMGASQAHQPKALETSIAKRGIINRVNQRVASSPIELISVEENQQ